MTKTLLVLGANVALVFSLACSSTSRTVGVDGSDSAGGASATEGGTTEGGPSGGSAGEASDDGTAHASSSGGSGGDSSAASSSGGSGGDSSEASSNGGSGGSSATSSGGSAGGSSDATSSGGATSGTTASGTTAQGGSGGTDSSDASGGTGGTSELSITTESLPQATLGEAYSTTLAASGTGTLTWSYTGSLPSGLSLASDGELSGIPTESGTFALLVSVFDGAGATAQTQLTLTIVAVIQDIAAGDEHTCALYNNGRIKCWGYNDQGQLGDNSTDASATPVDVFGVTTAVAIAAGSDNTCARLEDGSTVCWGGNASSQLGNGTSSSTLDYSTTPVQVSELSDTRAISVGSGASCALEPGAVSCWGAQATESTNQINATPFPVTGFDGTPTSISGGYTACALISGGDVQCWGGNYYGLLGNDTNETSTTPVSVQGLTAAAQQVEIGGYHACAVINGGSLQCWGDNYYDQLGVSGDTVPESWVARTVTGVSGVASVAVGSGSTCVLSNSGSVSCFGRNDCYGYPCGFIGSDTELKSAEPLNVWSGPPAAKAITLGDQHGCALLVTGEVVCWGDNYSLQLGQEGVTISAEPLTVPGL